MLATSGIAVPLLLLSGAAAVVRAAPPAASSWAQLKSSGQCVDANSGGPAIDTYACVPTNAVNIDNELFAHSDTTGYWLAKACGKPSGQCPPLPPQCVAHQQGEGSLRLAPCCNSTRWQARNVQQQGGSIGAPAGFQLSPMASPGQCAAATGGTIAMQPCSSSSAAQHFMWGATVQAAAAAAAAAAAFKRHSNGDPVVNNVYGAYSVSFPPHTWP